MSQNVIARGNIRDPDARLQAFGDDPRLDIIRPTPLASPPGLDNLASAHKTIATIHHTIPLPFSEDFSQARHTSGMVQINGARPPLTARS